VGKDGEGMGDVLTPVLVVFEPVGSVSCVAGLRVVLVVAVVAVVTVIGVFQVRMVVRHAGCEGL